MGCQCKKQTVEKNKAQELAPECRMVAVARFEVGFERGARRTGARMSWMMLRIWPKAIEKYCLPEVGRWVVG